MARENHNYGGQAVIEGVMMRGPEAMAVAVRDPAGSIRLDYRPAVSILKRKRWLDVPFLRGVFVLYDSMVTGLQALAFSASVSSGEEQERLSPWAIALTIGSSFLLGAGLFVLLPHLLTDLVLPLERGVLFYNLLEGVLRITIFVAYLLFIARMKDIRRVFQYHGAEHKVINAYEAGETLSAESARRYGTVHMRCGTSFVVLFILVSILVFSLAGVQNWVWRIATRLLLLPVVAGIAYEGIRLSGRYCTSGWARALAAPGRLLQGLTTGEPDEGQVEVALAALRALLEKSEEASSSEV